MDRAQLYDAINRRFDEMIARGLVEEVRRLIGSGYRVDRPPLSSIGYREIGAWLAGEMTMEEAVEKAKRESRRFAKRQMTWFRADPEVRWLDPSRFAEQAWILFREFFAGRAERQRM